MINSPSFKKLLVSIFILLNISTIIFANFPERLKRFTQLKISSSFPSFLLNKYGQFTGLCARWGMFANLDREKWWLLIKGKYKNQKEIILPLPRQSTRRFIDRFFFDFREAMLCVRLGNDKKKQERYASFLCRRFFAHNGSSIESIVFESRSQKILTISEANKLGYHYDPGIKRESLGVYKCF